MQTMQIKLSDWLTCKDELIALGFSDNEIEQALKDIKYSVDDLTDTQELEREPTYYKTYEMVKDWHNATFKRLVNCLV